MPTIEPRMSSPPRTVSKIGISRWLSAGRPTQTMRPPRASERYACSNGSGVTAVEIAASAPPSRWIAATGSCSSGLIRCSAPTARALSSRAGFTSTAITEAPVMRAYWTARWPRPPVPNTATRLDERAPESLTAL